jgi:hypothetical protein
MAHARPHDPRLEGDRYDGGKTRTRFGGGDRYARETLTRLISEGRRTGTLDRRDIDTAHVTSVGRFTS